MEQLNQIVSNAQNSFHSLIDQNEIASMGIPLENYKKFLSLQFHLTQGVQRHFYIAASHPDFEHKRQFREFLIKFANEEEPHFKLAFRDLQQLDSKPCRIPLDVKLWKAYFDSIIQDHPLIRLGATAILENITIGSTDLIKKALKKSSYLNPKNTSFLVTHLHEEVNHGQQILSALASAQLNDENYSDLCSGAEEGSIMYLRFMEWIFSNQ